MDSREQLLTPQEVASMLGLTVGTVYNWAYKRKLPRVKLNGERGPLRFRRESIERIIRKAESAAVR